jgi:hypothetical protein
VIGAFRHSESCCHDFSHISPAAMIRIGAAPFLTWPFCRARRHSGWAAMRPARHDRVGDGLSGRVAGELGQGVGGVARPSVRPDFSGGSAADQRESAAFQGRRRGYVVQTVTVSSAWHGRVAHAR